VKRSVGGEPVGERADRRADEQSDEARRDVHDARFTENASLPSRLSTLRHSDRG
jgi:hypothetical protein